uniref:Uncharacterized protein n=1 Tax=Setaria viridis TaxID=4556 RepID=A0A4U6W3J4_SETVI|nr:hypothetical protein SEVIR_1G015000v2 [Setaria viridis]
MAAFFTIMLLSPSHFEWAKMFMSSQAWRFMLTCTNTSSMMAFALPATCLENAKVQCSPSTEASDSSDGKVNHLSGPAKVKTKGLTSQVETEARRSPWIRSRNEGFKHNSCVNRNCLACATTPPVIPIRDIKKIEDGFCKINAEALSEDTLSNKTSNKQAIGSHRTSRKVISSKREKGKEKIDEIESQESRKKINK